jgi:D-alanyl-lipoteichoic acid acyltransferase DltB (MBOAT superfamily)
MLFQSFEFLVFLTFVFGLYWFILKRHMQAQNLLILAASYFFYGWWDWRFLGLIVFSTLIDFVVGLKITAASNQQSKKAWLGLSLLVNLGLLGYFKYANFFIESWIDAWSYLGISSNVSSLNVILPVGISFYTFQTLSYSIDVYRGDIKPTRNLINFAAFVSFFPQLVAGPIERASKLLVQLENKRIFKYEEGVAGLRLILLGLFKKVVIADTCALHVNDIFANYADYSGPTLMLGAIYFGFQLYGDFSGYSDIAIGTAKLFGIQLMTNFKMPFFARDHGEFWRRWHISMGAWFRDYLYIPLGGSRGGKWMSIRNVMIIFLVSGLWHGANWTFIAWGAIQGALFLPLLLAGKNRRHTSDNIGEGRWLPTGREVLQMTTTFALGTIPRIFFRSDDIQDANSYIIGMFHDLKFPDMHRTPIPYIFALLLVDWFLLKKFKIESAFLRYLIYGFAALLILVHSTINPAPTFIYFEF